MTDTCGIRCQPLVGLPHLFDLAMLTGFVIAMSALELWVAFLLRRPPDPWRVFNAVAFQALLLCIRSDVRLGLILAYVWWLTFGRNLPWRRWKNSLVSRASSLTEVARASLQRQQTEAFR